MIEQRVRYLWERLADVQVPRGVLWVIVVAKLVQQRQTDRVIRRFDQASSDFGTFLGRRMKEGDERQGQLLDLQRSIEALTRWLVVLTIVLGVIGLAGIGATMWAALK
jgi:hypothetical protein